ncbi:cell division protein FtsQ/DivIB [Devosia sp. FJ2-5-3]|uniref:cell division protein FtsQ/DivIB n=1 Tax=Devosia sp. FJ2-5-3 TaxID=2976680 RepID=UPI0023D89E21|nr:cell division protein FtsQ/DivIB [Devosia sp. FJ2-5-3]WEJ59856.1 FtsQ-type POTRA domain-containing protein [Devosia sp. FJ2-5-3]
MQQVKSEVFLAGARPIDPRALPVHVRRSRLARVTSGLTRLRVLHGGAMRRGAMIGLAIAAAAGIFQIREPIGNLLAAAGVVAQGGFAEAGLAIGEISISGQTLTSEQAIFDALGIQPDMSTLAFDVEAARQRLALLPAIATANVRKTYPGDVEVVITEKVPVARWRVDGITFVIDGQGEQIGEDGGAYGDLPLVIGDGAADDALVMIRALDNFPELRNNLIALSRIADRRWDMIYDTGLRIQLPEQGVAQALRKLTNYQAQYQLLDRDITVIDLRVESVVAVRPAVNEDTSKS